MGGSKRWRFNTAEAISVAKGAGIAAGGAALAYLGTYLMNGDFDNATGIFAAIGAVTIPCSA